MPKFSKRSLRELETCDLRLQIICKEAIKVYDFSVLEGYRSPERQKELLRQGVTKVERGKHNEKPSKAIDIEPYPRPKDNWKKEKDLRRFYFLAGIMFTIAEKHNIKLRWGGDWDKDYNYLDNDFDDLFHFEIMEN